MQSLRRFLYGVSGVLFTIGSSLADTNMPSLKIPIILKCISEIESGNVDIARGKDGERSRYQLKQEVWEQYTSEDFVDNAHDHDISVVVAHNHVSKLIKKTLVANPSINLVPGDIYILWYRGFGYYLSRNFKITNCTHDRMAFTRWKRFNNLYEKFDKADKQFELNLYQDRKKFDL